MGITDLRAVAAIETVERMDLDAGVAAVDAANWLYRYLNPVVQYTDESVYTTADGREVPNLVGLVQGLPKFLEADLVPAFVFDGDVPDLKSAELARRAEQNRAAAAAAAAAEEAGDEERAARLRARAQRLTDVMWETTTGLLDALGLPVLSAPAEAEAQAAHVARRGDAAYAVTEDYDALLFGAPRTLRQFTSSGPVEVMDLDETLDANDLTREQLVAVAVLCGTDYNEGVSGVGPATALSLVREHGTLEAALAARDATVPDADEICDLFVNPPVTDGYDLAVPDTLDVAAARSYVVDEWEVDADELERGFSRLADWERTGGRSR
ncbi:MAG: flap structure-specific endonuclease [Halobacteriaceae archaeon]